MASFQVVSEELTAAGAEIGRNDSELGAAGNSAGAGGGALSGTPAMMAYDDFLAALGPAVSSAHASVSALSTALQEAAAAYALSDNSAARALTVHKRGG